LQFNFSKYPTFTGISEDNKTLEWLALESPDENTAIEIAGMVVRAVWKYS